jgi:hypothetical protein
LKDIWQRHATWRGSSQLRVKTHCYIVCITATLWRFVAISLSACLKHDMCPRTKYCLQCGWPLILAWFPMSDFRAACVTPSDGCWKQFAYRADIKVHATLQYLALAKKPDLCLSPPVNRTNACERSSKLRLGSPLQSL